MIKQGEHIAYLEHFGITEDGKNFLYDKEELEAYKKAINDKVFCTGNITQNFFIPFRLSGTQKYFPAFGRKPCAAWFYVKAASK